MITAIAAKVRSEEANQTKATLEAIEKLIYEQCAKGWYTAEYSWAYPEDGVMTEVKEKLEQYGYDVFNSINKISIHWN